MKTAKLSLSYEQALNLNALFQSVGVVGFKNMAELTFRYLMKNYQLEYYLNNWEECDCSNDTEESE